MKSFVNKLQKDLLDLQIAIKKDSDELLKRVKSYANKDSIAAAGNELEKVVEERLKKFEPTLNKVVNEIRRNAAKAGINVDELETKVRSNVNRATTKLKAEAERRGFTKKTPSSSSKKSTTRKAKAPSAKAATRTTKAVTGQSKTPAKKKAK